MLDGTDENVADVGLVFADRLDEDHALGRRRLAENCPAPPRGIGRTWIFSRNSVLICCDQGGRNSVSSAMANTSGAENTSTGRIQAVSDTPEENQTTISESR